MSDSRARCSSSSRPAWGVMPRSISTPTSLLDDGQLRQAGHHPLRLSGPQVAVEHHGRPAGSAATPGPRPGRPALRWWPRRRPLHCRVPGRSTTPAAPAGTSPPAVAAPSSVDTVTSSGLARIVKARPRADGTATTNASCNEPTRSARSVPGSSSASVNRARSAANPADISTGMLPGRPARCSHALVVAAQTALDDVRDRRRIGVRPILPVRPTLPSPRHTATHHRVAGLAVGVPGPGPSHRLLHQRPRHHRQLRVLGLAQLPQPVERLIGGCTRTGSSKCPPPDR